MATESEFGMERELGASCFDTKGKMANLRDFQRRKMSRAGVKIIKDSNGWKRNRREPVAS